MRLDFYAKRRRASSSMFRTFKFDCFQHLNVEASTLFSGFDEDIVVLRLIAAGPPTVPVACCRSVYGDTKTCFHIEGSRFIHWKTEQHISQSKHHSMHRGALRFRRLFGAHPHARAGYLRSGSCCGLPPSVALTFCVRNLACVCLSRAHFQQLVRGFTINLTLFSSSTKMKNNHASIKGAPPGLLTVPQ